MLHGLTPKASSTMEQSSRWIVSASETSLLQAKYFSFFSYWSLFPEVDSIGSMCYLHVLAIWWVSGRNQGSIFLLRLLSVCLNTKGVSPGWKRCLWGEPLTLLVHCLGPGKTGVGPAFQAEEINLIIDEQNLPLITKGIKSQVSLVLQMDLPVPKVTQNHGAWRNWLIEAFKCCYMCDLNRNMLLLLPLGCMPQQSLVKTVRGSTGYLALRGVMNLLPGSYDWDEEWCSVYRFSLLSEE